MKYTVKILLINILSFNLVFSMEKTPGFFERIAWSMIRFVQPSDEQRNSISDVESNPRYIFSFSKDQEVDKKINTIIFEILLKDSLIQFFKDAQKYYNYCRDLSSSYRREPCSPDLTDFNKMMMIPLSLHKGSRSFVIEKLQDKIDLISKQKEIDLLVAFNYSLPPSLLRALGDKVKKDVGLTKSVNDELEDILKEKEAGYKKQELNEVFLRNFCTLNLIDGLSFTSGGLINQSMHLFPEKVIIQLWARYEKMFPTEESFKRDYLDRPQDREGNTLLMRAAKAGYSEVVEFLLDKGVDAKCANNLHMTAYRLADDASKSAAPAKIESHAKTLAHLRKNLGIN